MGSPDIGAMMAEDAANTPTNQELSELADLVTLMLLQEKEVERLDDELKAAKKALLETSMEKIPNLFDQVGLSEIRLSNGQVVTVKRQFAAHISQKNWPAALQWLRQNGHEAIVKHDVTVKLKKGEENQHRSLVAQLNDGGYSYADRESVHPGTLKAFVTEQLESGADLPMDVFGVHPVRTTKVS
jgi:hypothetical protein